MKATVGDGSMEQLGLERDAEAFEKLEISLEKDCCALEIEGESDGVAQYRIKERLFSERTLNLGSSSSPMTAKIEASVHNSYGNVEERNLGYHGGPEKVINSGDRYRLPLKQKITNCVGNGDDNTNMSRSEPGTHYRIKERLFSKRTLNLGSSSSPLTAKIEASVHNSYGNVEERNLGYHGGLEKVINSGDRYRLPLKQKITSCVGNGDDSTNMGGSEPGNSRRKAGIEETSAQLKSSAGSLMPTVIMDQCGLDRYSNPRVVDDWNKFSTSAYPDEGPSNYHSDSSYGYDMPIKNYGELYGSNPVAYPGNSRAELLRKLNELEEQISKSHVVDGEQQGRTPFNRKTSPVYSYHGHVAYSVPVQPMAPHEHIIPPYVEQYSHRPALHANNCDMNMQNFYFHPRQAPNNFSTYENAFQPQMPGAHSHQPPYDHFSAQSTDFKRELLSSYPHNSLYHQTSCSCFHCYNKNWHATAQVPTNAFGGTKFSKDPSDSNFSCHVNSRTFGLHTYEPQAEPSALQSRARQLHSRWPGDVDSYGGGFLQNHLRRSAVNYEKRQTCLPTAGGAPFITCCSCFELLKLPRRLKARDKSLQKLRCGTCSMVSIVEIENKRLTVSLPLGKKKTFDKDGDNGSCEVSKEHYLSSNSCLNDGVMSCPNDTDDPKCDDHSLVDAEFNKLSEEQMSNLSEPQKRWDLSSSSISYEAEESLSRRNINRDVMSDDLIRMAQDPHFQEHLGDLCSDHATRDISTSTFSISSEEKERLSRRNIHGDISSAELTRTDQDSHFLEHINDLCLDREGNRSEWRNGEKAKLNKDSCQQDSLKDKSMATEVEVSFEESLDTSLSQDSEEVEREGDGLRVKKQMESLFMGFIKGSLKDSSRSRQQIEEEKANVFVNGQPIPNSVVKQAEMSAGPIQPGDYWYDSQAGFWGVMGHACIGIIPPHIKEFDFPLPANCAAGDTGVFVNGRQLHKKDLDLLASRGLPTARDKLYIVEISGRVLDKDSGAEICNLGKLAPTVEKRKRGFGMKLPRRK